MGLFLPIIGKSHLIRLVIKMSDEILKEYFGIYTMCWKLFRKYSDPVDNEKFWDNLANDAENIFRSFGNKDFAKKIIIATVDEIESLYKTKKHNSEEK